MDHGSRTIYYDVFSNQKKLRRIHTKPGIEGTSAPLEFRQNVTYELKRVCALFSSFESHVATVWTEVRHKRFLHWVLCAPEFKLVAFLSDNAHPPEELQVQLFGEKAPMHSRGRKPCPHAHVAVRSLSTPCPFQAYPPLRHAFTLIALHKQRAKPAHMSSFSL